MGWKTRGMNQDMSVSAFNNEFSFENMNLRLSTNENNTLMSWVSEKGTSEVSLHINTSPWKESPSGEDYESTLKGYPLGTAVLMDRLVLFMSDYSYDYIYKLWKEDDDSMEGEMLYKGHLNFQEEYPIETLVSYEAEHIQKVYWTDGLNQPRVINIAASKDKLNLWNHGGIHSSSQTDTFFDFVPALTLDEQVTITNNLSAGGLFAPGVIQYCFTYVNKHGQQSNIAYVSPLYYLTYPDRGISPEGKASNVFQINIQNADSNFDYIRLYSIQRTSLNATPIVKRLEDLTISESRTTSYTDKGTTGDIIDPTELLFVGGREISALTMETKDQTLFLGNLTQKILPIDKLQNHFMDSEYQPVITFNNDKTLPLNTGNGVYSYTNTLSKNNRQITTFKGGDTYRFGFQLQKKTGEWSEPVWIGDETNGKYPSTSLDGTTRLISASATVELPNIGVDWSEYVNIRPVIVYPSMGDRNVLCQGVLNPTVFNALDRIDNSPFAQASWYFRPYMKTNSTSGESGEQTEQTVSDSDVFRTIETDEGSADEARTSSGNIDIFINNGYVKKVYVLIATGAAGNIDAILKRGYLKYSEGTTFSDPNSGIQDVKDAASNYFIFDGAIKIGNENTYAFVRDYPWPKEDDTPPTAYGANGHYFRYTDGWDSVLTPQESFDFYLKMKVNGSHLFYYVAPVSTGYNKFFFKFWDAASDQGFVVTFNALTDSGGIIVDVEKDPDNRAGDMLRFTHYDSLYTSDMYSDDDNTSTDVARQVEIQGSVQSYTSVDIGTKVANTKSNTQFFVDQSIVTLNSPDIEFNTEVQVYGNENLGLRIVGAIPITANASAHAIVAGSAMLESGHNIDTSSTDSVNRFGTGETNYNVVYNNQANAAGNRLVAGYMWSDVVVESDSKKDDKITTRSNEIWTHLIYPWHRNGSLNNDFRTSDVASSLLKTKKESNILYSANTVYMGDQWSKEVNADIVLTENDYVANYRLPKQGNNPDINYYANIDKVLYNSAGYKPMVSGNTMSKSLQKVFTPVSMKYKSTSHAVIALKTEAGRIPILPYGSYGNDSVGAYAKTGLGINTFWKKEVTISQSSINMSGSDCGQHNFLWLGELYKTENRTKFGEDTLEAIRNNTWQIGGAPEKIGYSNGRYSATLHWTEGDTYYQRYDCLKTYPFTKEDTNQLVEILSFMCETHVNIDGRYDRNRGQVDNTYMRPEIFNLLNPVYSQQDNFFTSKQIGSDGRDEQTYPNHVFYTKTKTSGEDVDQWTNVTLASTMEMDGDKGEVTSINRLNDQLICFQDTGISQILYNENTQISTTAGVPIEIANSGKVQGKRYLSNTIGCSNKWSIAQTPNGIYFVDSNDKGIYRLGGNLENLSGSLGMNTWAKNNLPAAKWKWDPVSFEGMVSYYDRQNQEVLFISSDWCLAFSEKFNIFTSFYSYEGTPYFCNLGDEGLWLRMPYTSTAKIWQHQGGDYCRFFGENRPYWMTLVGNPEPQADKVFTNLEFRASIDGDGETDDETGRFSPFLPFDYVEAWNEYQQGVTSLRTVWGKNMGLHHTNDAVSSLKRKFRIWRCDIPRDNYTGQNVFDSSFDTTFSGTRIAHPMNRMRNPWIYLKLTKTKEDDAATMNRAEIHDMLMEYFI